MDLIIIDLTIYNQATRPNGKTIRRNYITNMFFYDFLKALNDKLEDIKKSSEDGVELGYIEEITNIIFRVVSVIVFPVSLEKIESLNHMDCRLILQSDDNKFNDIE